MNLERAMETQRVKLLRLLTGWFAVVAFLSAGPVSLPLPRWVRAYFADLLLRAELAAVYLVQVSARLQAGDQWRVIQEPLSPFVRFDQSGQAVPSTAALLRRMRALRRVLQDLKRAGRRRLRRMGRTETVRPFPFAPNREGRAIAAAPQWIAPGVERPPDRLLIRSN